MKIAKITNGEIEWMGEHSTFFPTYPTAEQLAAGGFVYCSYRPYNRLTQKSVESAPVYENGEVFLDTIVDMTEAEVSLRKQEAMCKLRQERKALLVDCDYTQLNDYPHNDVADWAAYRQALRDFPATVADARLGYTFPLPPA